MVVQKINYDLKGGRIDLRTYGLVAITLFIDSAKYFTFFVVTPVYIFKAKLTIQILPLLGK